MDVEQLVEDTLYKEWVFKKFLEKLSFQDKIYLKLFLDCVPMKEIASLLGKSVPLVYKVRQKLMGLARENYLICEKESTI